MKILLVIGSRNFERQADVEHYLRLAYLSFNPSLVISGGAKGIDTWAVQVAKRMDIDTRIIFANWDKYGKSAGYKRNIKLWELCDVGLAFWDGKSKGTAHSFELCKQFNKRLVVVGPDMKIIKEHCYEKKVLN